MRLVQIYRTESDWCALVAQTSLRGEQRLTLTYAEQPDEAQVLADAESAFLAAATVTPVLEVDETATLDDKKALVRGQVTAAAALASTEPELADVAETLNSVAASLSLVEGLV